MSRTRGYFTATVLALTLGLTACSGSDAEPEPAPPPSSASSSPSDAPAAPTMPPEARGIDPASVKAFVRFYQLAVNHAQRTGEVDALRSLTRGCRGCDAGIHFITSVYGGRGRITGGDGRAVDFRIGFVGPRHERAVVECTIITTKQVVDLPGSRKDRVYRAGRLPVRFILDPSDSGWLVRYLGAQ